MNKTFIFLGAAGLLALVALVARSPPVDGTPVPHSNSPPTTVAGSLRLEGRLSHPVMLAGNSDLFVAIDVSAPSIAGLQRAAVNLALVIDRSGSMSGAKLNHAKAAARQLVNQLGSEDRLAIVHYGSDVKSTEGLRCTVANKEKLQSYIDGIFDEGGTNIGEGLLRAKELLSPAARGYRVNRIILISDGQPTEGLTGDLELQDLARQVRRAGFSLSSIGVGTDFNEVLMESFAELGGGAYAFLADAEHLSEIFERDLAAAGTQVARDVTLSLQLGPDATLEEVLGYSTTRREGRLVTIALPDFAAGQKERVVAHLKVRGAAIGQAVDVANLHLEYHDLMADAARQTSASLSTLVSASSDEVAARRDRDAILFAARARSAGNTRAAAEALRSGQQDEARRLIRANQGLFEEAAEVAGAQAVVDDLKGNASFLRRLGQTLSDDEVRTFSKDSRRKARIDFGLMGSTY